MSSATEFERFSAHWEIRYGFGGLVEMFKNLTAVLHRHMGPLVHVLNAVSFSHTSTHVALLSFLLTGGNCP